MAIPDYETLMLTVLRAFDDGATSVKECLPTIQAAYVISDAEAAELLPSGTTTVLSSRAHWARTYLAKAGLLYSPKRGRHQITEKGRAILAKSPDRLDNEFLRREFSDFDAWIANARRTGRDELVNIHRDAEQTPSVSPEEAITKAASEIEAELRDELLSLIRAMDPIAFERLVLRLLEAMGYGAGSLGSRMTTKATGDGGIDGIIHEDALGLDAVYIQAKRYAPDSKVGRPALQQFVGSLTGEGATKGVFVTTSSFSAEARDFLTRVQHRIVLIDGNEFARLMIRHNVGVRVMQTIHIKAVDENTFADI